MRIAFQARRSCSEGYKPKGWKIGTAALGKLRLGRNAKSSIADEFFPAKAFPKRGADLNAELKGPERSHGSQRPTRAFGRNVPPASLAASLPETPPPPHIQRMRRVMQSEGDAELKF